MFRFRYYPVLISLHIKNPFVKVYSAIYVVIIIAYTIYRESVCLDFLPHSENFSALDEVQLRIVNRTLFYRVQSIKEKI